MTLRHRCARPSKHVIATLEYAGSSIDKIGKVNIYLKIVALISMNRNESTVILWGRPFAMAGANHRGSAPSAKGLSDRS